MDRKALWQALATHPLSGWLRPAPPSLLAVDPEVRLLWCGIGGSLAPAEALVQALASRSQRRRWMPLSAPDPEPFELHRGDQLVFASKSGRTLELWSWIAMLRALPAWGRWDRPPLVLTQDDGNPLAAYAKHEGWPLLPLPSDVGGRFSAFTAVGLLPVAWMGWDPGALLQLAREVVREAETGMGPWGARIWGAVDRLLAGYRRGVRAWAFMPYGRRLSGLSAWWVQLLAESLGKINAHGERLGWLPLRAHGPQDQHAQLQRWIGGAQDLGVLLMVSAPPALEPRHDPPPSCPFPGLSAVGPAQLLELQAQATQRALEEAGVPTLCWHLEEGPLDFAACLMAWQIIVALLGFATQVDPFDQPEVEASKRWMTALLKPQGEGIRQEEARAAGR